MPADGFITYIQICILAGLFFSSPWVLYQFWLFIVTGLRSPERRFVKLAAPISGALFIAGGFFFLKIVSPMTLRFFIGFNKKMLGIDSAFTFEKYIFFIINMILVFGFAFQTPTAMLFLNKLGLCTIEKYQKLRKYILLGIFIVSAIITPPDIVSQIALAVPLYLLFELGILISRTDKKVS